MTSPHQILIALAFSIRDLLRDDDLVKAKPEEISITTELAMKMMRYYEDDRRFPDTRVSPEWTRREDEEKKLAWNDAAGKRKLKKIRPDILVHKMHTQERNLLVVEAKRIQNKKFTDDIRKLTLMTLEESVDPDCHYGYVVGVHLVIDLPNRAIARSDVYRNGSVDERLTGWFGGFLKYLTRPADDRAAAVQS